MKKNVRKLGLLYLCVVLSSIMGQSAYAYTIVECSLNTTVLRVYQGHHAWEENGHGYAQIGIMTSDGKLHYSLDRDVRDDPEMRALLQMAITAYASRKRVVIYHVGDCDPDPIGGENWINSWNGMRIYD